MNESDVFDVITELIGPTGRKILALGFVVGVLLFHDTTMHIFNWLAIQRAHELSTMIIHAATPARS